MMYHRSKNFLGAVMITQEESIASMENLSLGKLPSKNDIILLLQKFRKERNLECSRRVHSCLRTHGLECDAKIGNYLVPMLVDCGSVLEAEHVFNKLSRRNEHSWNSLIQGYVDHGEFNTALELYERMRREDVCPNRCTLQLILRASGRLKNIKKVREIHAEMIKEEFESDCFIASSLVDIYVKCGLLFEAQEVFEELETQDTVSWTALIVGYVDNGLFTQGLQCFEKMQMEGSSPDAVTYVSALKACSGMEAMGKAQEIHLDIVKVGLEGEPFIGSMLVNMHAKHGSLVEAEKLFDEIVVRDVVLWNVLIAAYAEHGEGEKARLCLENMRKEGVSPNDLTFISSLKGHNGFKDIVFVRDIYTDVCKEGLERDPLVGSALVDMYTKCGSLAEARMIFHKLSKRNVISWTALISGYVEYGLGSEALTHLKEMQLDGVAPNDVTYVCSLKACGLIGALDKGRQIHADLVVEGFEADIFVGNTLIDMYARCGSLTEARELFDELQTRDVVSWNALSSRCDEHGFDEDVLKCLEQMQLEGVIPDVLTYVCGLKACSSIGAIDKGQILHAEISVDGYGSDSFIRGTLVDMYAKCGALAEAHDVFDDMPTQDVVVWNALVAGYACQGQNEVVLYLFEQMKLENVYPNPITFLSVLTVCSHAGLVVEGQCYFDMMGEEYGLPLTVEHYNCMVDLLGRAGRLEEAVAILYEMPFQPNLVTWSTLLGACRKGGDIELARQAFESAYKSDEKHYALFISMSRIYAGAHMWEDAKVIDVMRITSGMEQLGESANLFGNFGEWAGIEENCTGSGISMGYC